MPTRRDFEIPSIFRIEWRRVLLIVPLAIWGGFAPFQEAGWQTDRPTLAFVSDTQAPLIAETLFRPGSGNKNATRLIFSDIRRLHPSHLFILGDLVSLGFQRSAWEAIDRYVTELRGDSVPVDALLGNHELMLYGRAGEENFESLFPGDARTGYVRLVDSIAVVMLNSNFGSLSVEETESSQRWYETELDLLQSDQSIRAVIVCCHHPPFTNSVVVTGSREVRDHFLPRFMATPKCILFLSGHAHTYEHFVSGGKDFMVIGGGGGPSHPLREDPEFDDISPATKPLFHYIAIHREGDRLNIEVRGITEGSNEIRDVYQVRTGG